MKLLLHFNPTVEASLKNRKRLILKKMLPLPAPFQHFRFRVRFRFQPLLSKCFRSHKKLTASTASASTSLFISGENFFILVLKFKEFFLSRALPIFQKSGANTVYLPT